MMYSSFWTSPNRPGRNAATAKLRLSAHFLTSRPRRPRFVSAHTCNNTTGIQRSPTRHHGSLATEHQDVHTLSPYYQRPSSTRFSHSPSTTMIMFSSPITQLPEQLQIVIISRVHGNGISALKSLALVDRPSSDALAHCCSAS